MTTTQDETFAAALKKWLNYQLPNNTFRSAANTWLYLRSLPPSDTAAPSAPGNLQATATTSRVNLTWSPSTDNVAVTGYRIYRGGVPVGSSATTSFSDAGPFTPNTQYSYFVRAIDAAGNISGASNAQTLLWVGVVAPPPPAPTGWTAFPATEPSGEGTGFSGAGTRTVKVSSSSGSDGNTGTEASPKKTIAAALATLRAGKADRILLKRGDTWTEGNNSIDVSGAAASTSSCILVGAYGVGARPLIKVTTSTEGFAFLVSSKDNIAFVGIEIYAHDRDPHSRTFNAKINDNCAAITVLNSKWIWLEDCKFSFFTDNVVLQGVDDNYASGYSQLSAFTVRRCGFYDSYGIASHSSGLYIENCYSYLVEENIADHNGWNTGVSGATPNIFNHNFYLNFQGRGPGIFRGNISCRPSSHGVQLRSGGVFVNNLFVECAIAGFVAEYPSSVMTDNVVLHGIDINASTPRGDGLAIILENQDPGIGGRIPAGGVRPNNSFMSRNIVAHSDVAHTDYALTINLDGFPGPISDCNMSYNVLYQWGGPTEFWILDEGTGTIKTNNVMNGSGYSDPNRTIAAYSASVGGAGTRADFYSKIRGQSRDTYDTNYTAGVINNYFRAGFDMRLVG